MTQWPTDWIPAPRTALLVLLVAGHVLADFATQTSEGIEAKRRGSGYASHAVVVFATQLLVLLPMLSVAVAAVVAAVAVLHAGIDRVKARWLERALGPTRSFALDQAAHLAVLVAGWRVLVGAGAVPDVRWLSVTGTGTYLEAAILAAAFAFNATGGSVIVEGVLGLLPGKASGGEGPGGSGGPEPAGHEGAGRLIGILERTLALALILYGAWAAVALLVAAKSIARFEELKVREFAEYYLVGTLASLLVAVGVGFALADVLFPLLR